MIKTYNEFKAAVILDYNTKNNELMNNRPYRLQVARICDEYAANNAPNVKMVESLADLMYSIALDIISDYKCGKVTNLVVQA